MSRIGITQEKIISILIIVVSLLLMGGIGFTMIMENKKDEPVNEEILIMPDLEGYSFEEAKDYYKELFEISEAGQDYSEEYPAGAILLQSIEAGKEYEKGAYVEVTVSLGDKQSETEAPVTEITEETVKEEESTAPEEAIDPADIVIDNSPADLETYIPEDEVELDMLGFGTVALEGRASEIYNGIYNILRPKGVDAGFMYYDPRTGRSMEYNADERFSAGSIIKAIYARSILDGSVDMDTEYEMTEEMLNSPYELVNGQPVGTVFTVRELIEAALIKSDNTAYKMLYNYVGYDKFNGYAESLGLSQRMTDDNYWFRLTARETMIYFKEIYNFISQHPNGVLMKKCMTNTEYRDMFAAALPDKTVAEKYGYLPQEDFYTLGDCAIISGEDDDYILVMYWRNTGSTADTSPFRQIAVLTDEFHEIMK